VNPLVPGPEIYDGIEALGLAVDLQGWHSDRPVFADLLRVTAPSVIIEVGSWKGASAVHMGRVSTALGLRPTILCVDTWLGSLEIWAQPHLARLAPRRHGYPQVYFQFLHNVKAAGLQHQVVPLVATSAVGARMLRMLEVQAELVYIDGSHEYRDVTLDLQDYWPLVRAGGVMFGDDCNPNFPGVQRAVREFAAAQGLPLELREENFWILRKDG
jgi:hypothetical protein